MPNHLKYDYMNNVNRRCSLKGDTKSRQWKVMHARADGSYHLLNVSNGKTRTALMVQMRNLY